MFFRESFDFLDLALVLRFSDMAFLMPEVWDFYFLSSANVLSIMILRFFIDFHSWIAPGTPQVALVLPRIEKKTIFCIFFQNFAYKPILDRLHRSETSKIG